MAGHSRSKNGVASLAGVPAIPIIDALTFQTRCSRQAFARPIAFQATLQRYGWIPIAFELAQRAFLGPRRVIAEDLEHSRDERRYFCFGEVDGAVMTVRFTWRDRKIRIIGAGYWRKGKKVYEESNR